MSLLGGLKFHYVLSSLSAHGILLMSTHQNRNAVQFTFIVLFQFGKEYLFIFLLNFGPQNPVPESPVNSVTFYFLARHLMISLVFCTRTTRSPISLELVTSQHHLQTIAKVTGEFKLLLSNVLYAYEGVFSWRTFSICQLRDAVYRECVH